MIKSLLMLSVLAFSGASFAATTEVDSTSALVLTLGATPAKIQALMTGANALKLTQTDVNAQTIVYKYVAQRCDSGVVLICKDLASLNVTAAWVNQGERSHYEYSSGTVKLAKK